MENNSGNTLKIIAVILGILGVIGAVILGVTVGNNTYIDGLGFGTFVGVAFSAFLSALMLYGFGELIDNSAQINERMVKTEKQLEEIKVRLGNVPVAAEAPQAVCTVPAPQAAPAADAKPVAETEVKTPAPVEKKAPVDVPAGFENLNTAKEIYKRFCELYEGKQNENTIAMEKLLLSLCQREENGEENMGGTAIKMLKSYYKHGEMVYKVDRSSRSMQCPVCLNTQTNTRYRCFSCHALFRD